MSRSLPLLYGRIFSRPQLVHPETFSNIMFGLQRHFDMAAPDARALSETLAFSGGEPEYEAEVPGSIAVIGVHGVLVHRQGMFEGCGVRSYESLREDIEAAIGNSNVSAILLDIDSGGGECSGLFDFCDWLKANNSEKPIYAFCHDHAYSAAFAIAACAQKIFIGQTGGCGSIGVVSAHVDESGLNEKIGIVITPIYAGNKKVDGWAHAPLSESAKADWQRDVDSIYNVFVNHVAEARSLDEQVVRDTEAGCYPAVDAVAMGLVDEIASFDQVISEIFASSTASGGNSAANTKSGHSAQKIPTAHIGGNMLKKLMSRPARSPAASTDDKAPADDKEKDAIEDDEDKNAADDQPEPDDQEAAEPEPEDDTEGEDEEPVDDSDKEEQARADGYAAAMAVVEACALNGKGSKTALSYLKKGLSADAARKDLIAKSATKPKADVVNSHTATGGKTGAERMADKMKQISSKKGK